MLVFLIYAFERNKKETVMSSKPSTLAQRAASRLYRVGTLGVEDPASSDKALSYKDMPLKNEMWS